MTDLVYIRDTGITAPASSLLTASMLKMEIEYSVQHAADGSLVLMQQPRLYLKTRVKVLGGDIDVALPVQTVDLLGIEGQPLMESSLVAELDDSDRKKLDKMVGRAALRWRNVIRAKRAIGPAALASTDGEAAAKALSTAETNLHAKAIAHGTMVKRISSFIGENVTTFGGLTAGDDEGDADEFGLMIEVIGQLDEAGMMTEALYQSITKLVKERNLEVMEPLNFAPADFGDDDDGDGGWDDAADEDEAEDDLGEDDGDTDEGIEDATDGSTDLPEVEVPAATEAPVPTAPRILHAVPPAGGVANG